MSTEDRVRILQAALAQEPNDSIVLRGLIEQASLSALQVDSYQRDVLAGGSFEGLVEAFKLGHKVPDITLGMRGGDYTERGGIFTLRQPVYMVDGLQRVSAGLRAIELYPEVKVTLGATIYFNTTQEWERGMFKILNADRIKVSPNVLLRNFRHDNVVVMLLYRLATETKDFVLYDRVCWNQRMRRNDIIYAMTFLKTVGWLHAHMGPGRSNQLYELADSMVKTMEKVGKNTFRENIRTFFELLDQCWDVRNVVYHGAVHMRSTFLRCLARLFSTHHRFFFDDGKKLVVDRDTRSKLKSFPLRDPQVINLAGSGGQGGNILYNLLVAHINRGRRTRRLIEVTADETIAGVGELEDETTT